MSSAVILKAIELGLVLSVLSLGVYISFRILDIPDLTVDGSFSTGAATVAVMTMAGAPMVGLFAAFLAGCVCGIITALLQTIVGFDSHRCGDWIVAVLVFQDEFGISDSCNR